MKKILMVIFILFCTTGCYNYRELNDIAIVSGISISKSGNDYKVTVEVVNSAKQLNTTSSDEAYYVMYESTSSSLQEAFRSIIKESPERIYGKHMQILIIDENIAKNDLKYVLDFFSRNPEIRSEFYVLIGKDEKILEITTPIDTISSANIYNSLEANSKYLGIANIVTYHDLVSTYLSDKKEIVLPSISGVIVNNEADDIENISSTESRNKSVIDTLAVFKNNKLIGYLSEEESLMYNIIMNNVDTSLIKKNYSKREYVINEIINSKCDIEVKPEKNEVNIKIKGKAAVEEVDAKFNMESTSDIKKIENDLNNKLEEMVSNSIKNIIKEYDSDIFGFEDLYYKKNPKYYNKHIKGKWYSKYFSNIGLKVKSDISIFEKGNLNGGLYDTKG